MIYFIITLREDRREPYLSRMRQANIFNEEHQNINSEEFGSKPVSIFKNETYCVYVPQSICYDENMEDTQLRNDLCEYITSFMPKLMRDDKLYLLIHHADLYGDRSRPEQQEILENTDILYNIHPDSIFLYCYHTDGDIGYSILGESIGAEYLSNLEALFTRVGQ